MMSKFTAMIVCCLAMTIIFVFGTQGEISITSEPEKIVYQRTFTLTCHIGALTDEVKWIYKGITYFSCISPYSAGLCFINRTASYYHSPDVNTTAGVSTIRMYTYENQSEGLWTCHHGRDSSIYNVNPVDNRKAASVTSFTSSPSSRNINVGTTITFTCTVSSTTLLPVNVSISSLNREGNLTYVINSSSRTFTVSTVAQCIDYWFYCRAYNGYGYVYTRNLYKTVTCPFKLLKDKTNTTVNATVGSYGNFYAYYSGYPSPSYTWYRRVSQVEIKMNSYRTSWSQFTDALFLQIYDVRLEDAGQYIVHINATGKVVIVIFTLNVNPAPTSSSIAIGQKSETQNVGTLQQNSTMKAEELGPSTIQPFISATGLGIGIAVGVITTFLILGVFLLVSRLLKSRDVKAKEVKSKSINKDQDKNKVKQSDYDNTAYNPSEEETYENLELN